MVSDKTLKMINDLKNKNAQLRTDILAALYTIHHNEKNRKSKRRSRNRSRKGRKVRKYRSRSRSRKGRKVRKSRSRSRSRKGRKVRKSRSRSRSRKGRKVRKSRSRSRSRKGRKARKSRKQHKGGHNSSLPHEHLVKGGKKNLAQETVDLIVADPQKKRMVTKLLNKICKINNMTGGSNIPQITGGCNSKCSR